VTDIDVRWAFSQVEAMADGSLPPAEERRFRAAMKREPRLSDAVQRATRIRRTLRRLGAAPVPRSLSRRLAALPPAHADSGRPRTPAWSWAAAGAALAIAAVLVTAIRPQAPVYDERAAALREFEVAMAYLHKSYEIAGEQVRRAMVRELRGVVERESGSDTRPDESNGG
jgi:anti-sigma factor RsiW